MNYLDITLNLYTGKFAPYQKPNNVPLYVNQQSNHPPQIIRNIPTGINKRLTAISSDFTTFSESISPYQQALANSGYNHTLTFSQHNDDIEEAKPHKRKRNVTWFNPPYSRSVKTNIGKRFLNIIDKEFPPEHILHSIFNRSTVKLSYSCMKNIKTIIDTHNKKLLAIPNQPVDNAPPTRICNCRVRSACPLDGECLTTSIVYQATVTTTNKTETYIGSTATDFKARLYNHSASFKHSSKRTSTELSKYIWSLKHSNTSYNIKWNIVQRAKACSSGMSRCGLCLAEKYYIIFQPAKATLNNRNALVSSCRHHAKFILCNYNS